MIRTLNLSAALMLGGAITFVLFFLMQWMLAGEAGVPMRGERRIIGDISIPELVLDIRRETPRPLEPLEPEAPPELPPATLDNLTIGAPGIDLQQPPSIEPTRLADGGLGPSDAGFLPLVTIKPQYPQRALLREIEGWCLVSFTVDENGSVVDAVVLDAEPANIFDSAALRAISRFKFNPRVENGVPVRSTGVQYVFTFELED